MDPFLRSDLELERQLSPGEKLAQALELMEAGIQLKRATLRRQNPEASEAQVDLLLIAWLSENDE